MRPRNGFREGGGHAFRSPTAKGSLLYRDLLETEVPCDALPRAASMQQLGRNEGGFVEREASDGQVHLVPPVPMAPERRPAVSDRVYEVS